MEFREIGKCRLFHFLSCVWEGLATLLNNCTYTLYFTSIVSVVVGKKIKKLSKYHVGPFNVLYCAIGVGRAPPPHGLFLFIHVTHVP